MARTSKTTDGLFPLQNEEEEDPSQQQLSPSSSSFPKSAAVHGRESAVCEREKRRANMPGRQASTPGKYSQASTSVSSIRREVESSTRRDGKKGIPRPREYTHTLMGIHEDIGDLKKGQEEICNTVGIGSFSNQTGCRFI
ncbi:hypothetical protein DAPPUDRAFT_249162 [Daphnia pulex]|uniref:Uncharacterized protein n=1 Tax=Daphnia pulex TaxID=6669 RepID=E9GW03_DAPPU|nr:hypothetical protein DAPPUDRAFT_249162 [Daphnia pulex]|eukprot:EFX76356.1 hypothetical protein DAPPUDRAFT_249162 [Daphnia pulex]